MATYKRILGGKRMKTYKITEKQREIAIQKVELSPYSLINDGLEYRAGYIRALQDLGLIDGLTAARMTIEVTTMWEGWENGNRKR